MVTIKEISEYSKFSVKNLFKRKLRSWLTIIGIFIGIAAIVALISLGQGLQDAITSQFQMLGTDKIIILPGGPFGIAGTGSSPESTKITRQEVEAIKDVRGVELVSYSGIKMARIEFDNRQRYAYVWGVALDRSSVILEEIGNLVAESGRELRPGDKYKAQLGYLYGHSTDLFPKKIRPGDTIKIEGVEFQVAGVSKKIGNNQDDSMIIIPIDTF